MKHSEETKKKISEAKKGSVPWNKGLKDAQPKRIGFMHSGDTKQHCTQRGGKLNADHIKPFCLYPELRLELNNGRTLCVPCHRLIGWSLFKENNPRKKETV